jgi:hypothetical protein
MIWVRRGFAIPLIILFVILFIAYLIVTQVNNSFGSADFYNKQMHKADMYNFVYDKALPAALDEIEEKNPAEDIPVHLSKVKEATITNARVILPPEWIEAQFELATKTFLPYFLGSTDEFTYTLVGKDRVDVAARVIKDDFLQGETFLSVYNDGMSYLAEKMSENLEHIPYDIPLTKEQIESAIKKVVPPEWVIKQVGSNIDSVTPYLTRNSDHFTVRFQVEDRVDIAAAVALDILSKNETYQYLMDEMIAPTIEKELGPAVNLPFGISLTKSEIIAAIEEILPPSWIQAQFKELIYSIATYVKGESKSISVAVDLTDRKAAAGPVLTNLADQKLSSLFNSLPICSWTEFRRAILSLLPNSIPLCRPSSVSYEQFKSYLHISIADVIRQMVIDQIPNQWSYTDADLRQSMGSGNEGLLDDARQWVRDGYTYTDVDLNGELNPDEEKTLEDVRDWVANGYTVTEQDLREKIAENNPDDIKTLDDARSAIHSVRKWSWAITLAPFLLLVGIAYLAGRDWKGRVFWAFITLFVTSFIIYITLTVVSSHAIKPAVKDAFDLSDKTGLELVMLEKGQEVALNVTNGFVGGIESKALGMMIISVLVLAGTTGWSVVNARRQKDAEIISESG